MSNLTHLHLHAAPAHAATAHAAGNPFWSDALGSGTAHIASLAAHIDALSPRIGQLPRHTQSSRPAVIQYLCMLRTLATAWQWRSRPALAAALAALALVGDTLAQPAMLEALVRQRLNGGHSGTRAADALLRRLAAPADAFGALSADFGSYLAQMARASAALEYDTARVTQQVQSEIVHALLLTQQANALQSKLDEAGLRARAGWPPCPHAPQRGQHGALHGSALAGVHRQLGQLHRARRATGADAAAVQHLLPSLAAYLAAIERLGAGIDTTLLGARALQGELTLLGQALAAGNAASAEAQLRAALPHWTALRAAAACLQRPGSAPA